LPLFSILTYAAFTRVIGIVHLVPWYLGLHITVFVIFAAGYYLSPSYKWFYLFLVMLVARGVGFPEAGEDLLLSFALLGNFNIFQCLVLIAANYHSLASAIPTCLLLLYDHSTYNS
jgi:hypothetical protein